MTLKNRKFNRKSS